MFEQQISGFFSTYDLTQAQKQPKNPAAHQHTALDKLHKWFQKKHSDAAGGILALPTGGGKTFTADRFLCTDPLSDGYKVLWLAHTHHLLDQAFYSLASEVKLIRNKQQLNVRVVSGTKGHFSPAHIDKSDDVIICTLQTVTRAHEKKHAQLIAFLEAAGNKLFVVFDEAHHSPAPSYCRFITALRDRCPEMYLLGLTATPTYTDERKSGWLKKLFPQGILYQVSPKDLMAAKILAQPIFEQSQTTFTPEFDEIKYKQWVRDYQDLPEEIITKLAENRDRNAFIAKTYADNKEHYGKTIIFADRWFQCEQLRGFLEEQKKGIRVGTIYAHIDADPGSADARNKRDRDENAKTLEAFRNAQLDVLINVRMLTEGTDIPKVETVFLTRQTTSKILLTQMVGRALRGPEFEGTEKAYIVSFIDNWQPVINWAEYDPLEETPTIDDVPKVSERLPMQLISIDMVRRLIEKINIGVVVNDVPFLTFMPIGWYRVEFETLTDGSENTEIVQRLVMVFKNEIASYKSFIEHLKNVDLEGFVKVDINFESQRQRIENWQKQFFSGVEEHISGDLLANLFHITLHMAQKEKEPPNWFNFEQRNDHDLDAVGQIFLDEKLDREKEDKKLNEEYQREDRYWKIIYYSYELFKSQYNTCIEWLLATKRRRANPEVPCSTVTSKPAPRPEPSDEFKQQVKKRDGFRCLCCGEDNSHLLQIDHINAKYHGGDHSLDNLQTLCDTCNQIKGTREIDFRKHQTSLKEPLSNFPKLELIKTEGASEIEQWEYFLRRSVNFFYHCAAVESINVKNRELCIDPWEIHLYVGNHPRWLKVRLEELGKRIREVRAKGTFDTPYKITITGSNFDVI